MDIDQITSEDVRRLREENGMSMMDAKLYLTLRHDYAILEKLQKEGTLEEKVDFLLQQDKDRIEKTLSERFRFESAKWSI